MELILVVNKVYIGSPILVPNHSTKWLLFLSMPLSIGFKLHQKVDVISNYAHVMSLIISYDASLNNKS